MLAFVCLVLVLMLVASRRVKGPLWALGLAWLVCLTPIATGGIRYAFLSQWDVGYAAVLVAYLSCFAIGALLADAMGGSAPTRAHRIPGAVVDAGMRTAYPWAIAAWWIAAIGTVLLCIDFVLLEGVGLDDLAALRDVYVAKEASLFARLGSIMTWGCLYSFAFALMYRDVMSMRQFAFFMLPIGGYFLVALFSAGRQAAMQILIFALLTIALKRARRGANRARRKSGVPLALAISVAMVSYMGYVAGARNDDLISDDKTEVLAQLFDYDVSEPLNWLLSFAGSGLRTTLVEGMVYFSSSVALFSKFLTVEFPKLLYGAMSLPFVMRQLEPLTGISVIGALNEKIELMRGAGVIGVGWTTGISSYIIDFGTVGAGFILFLQGYYSAFAWRRGKEGTDFHEGVVALIMLTAAIYMPLLAASSDTNLLLLWLYCVTAISMRRRRTQPPNPFDPTAAPTTVPRKSNG